MTTIEAWRCDRHRIAGLGAGPCPLCIAELQSQTTLEHERDVWHARAEALSRDLDAAERRIAELERALFEARAGR
jgi:hypothetical protein